MARKKITVEAMCEAFDKYKDFSCVPKTSKYHLGQVIDEDKSVKWNREEVQRLNDLRIEEVKLLHKQKNKLYEEFKDMVCKYITQETKVDKARSIKIFKFLEQKECLASNGQFCCDILDDLLEAFLQIKKEK